MTTRSATETAYREKLFEFVRRCRADPVFFASEALGVHLWSKQQEIARSVRDNRRTAVKACHGPGKTLTAAVVALWFLRLPGSRVITTATTWAQVRDQLWHEINRLHRGARYPLGGKVNQVDLRMEDGRYAVGLSTEPGRQEAFQGHHAENILLIIDEASGVPAPIYESAEGYMTTPGARQLLIGNPIHPHGDFYAAFTARRERYETFTISVFDTPNFTDEDVPLEVAQRLVSKEWVKDAEHWQGGPEWDYRVLGEFPRQAEDTVISLSLAENAARREIPDELIHPTTDVNRIACDVARFGSDETVIMHRKGKRVRLVTSYVGKDLMQTCGRIIEAKNETGATEIVVDDAGVGGGVTDRLREQGHSVQAHNGGEKPIDTDAFVNTRTEVWFTLADELLDADIPHDPMLLGDLVAPVYKFDSQGRKVLEPKEQTKKRIGRSPDRGDTLAMCFAPARGSVLEVW